MGILTEFISWLPKYFFPKICYGCEKEGAYVCQECRKTVERTLDRPLCSECGREAAFGITHSICRRKYGLDGLISFYKYAGWAKKIIKQAKFGKHHRWAAMKELAKDLATSQPYSQLKTHNSQQLIIVPVPLHWWREFKRGFNQAELVAEELAEGWKIPIVKMLTRRQYTQPQTLTEKEVKLTKTQEKELEKKYKSSLQLEEARKKLLNKLKAKRRRENIKEAFEANSVFSISASASHSPTSRTIRSRLVGRSSADKHHSVLVNVILVDDVWTTGATMKECCRVLKKAGVKKVWGITLLRA